MASMRKMRAVIRRHTAALDAYYTRIADIADTAKDAIDRETKALVKRYPALADRARALGRGLAGLVRP